MRLGRYLLLIHVLLASRTAAANEPLKVAAVVTSYFHNSHADVIVSRLLEGYSLNGKGPRPNLKLVSLYTDQVPANDKSRILAGRYGVPIHESIAGALTQGGDVLAVDGVLLVAEHGDYPNSPVGQTQYPKRRFFAETVDVFRRSGRVVPVFIDKHLADNWEDARWIYDQAHDMKIPLMAGSSLPTTWRHPPADVAPDRCLAEVAIVSYHTLDTYGFHALEALACLVEQRRGGETGVKGVRSLEGDAVWRAAGTVYDPGLLEAAVGALENPQGGQRPLSERVPAPVLFSIEYDDGLKANVFTLNGAAGEWTAAWRYEGDSHVESTLFWTQEARPLAHFSLLVEGIEHMFTTGKAAWPVERTLMSSGMLNALMRSKSEMGVRIATPHLQFGYSSPWRWQVPLPPPPGRPLDGQ